MNKKFLSGTIFGLGLGIGLSFVTPIISQPIDIKINGKNSQTNTKSSNIIYTTKNENKADKGNEVLNENLQKMLTELRELNSNNKEVLKHLKSIDNNTKFQNPYGASSDK